MSNCGHQEAYFYNCCHKKALAAGALLITLPNNCMGSAPYPHCLRDANGAPKTRYPLTNNNLEFKKIPYGRKPGPMLQRGKRSGIVGLGQEGQKKLAGVG